MLASYLDNSRCRQGLHYKNLYSTWAKANKTIELEAMTHYTMKRADSAGIWHQKHGQAMWCNLQLKIAHTP